MAADRAVILCASFPALDQAPCALKLGSITLILTSEDRQSLVSCLLGLLAGQPLLGRQGREAVRAESPTFSSIGSAADNRDEIRLTLCLYKGCFIVGEGDAALTDGREMTIRNVTVDTFCTVSIY